MRDREPYQTRRAKELGLPKGTGKRYSRTDLKRFINACSSPNRLAAISLQLEYQTTKDSLIGLLDNLKGTDSLLPDNLHGYGQTFFASGGVASDLAWVESMMQIRMHPNDISFIWGVKKTLEREFKE
jgi:hypothetical protein